MDLISENKIGIVKGTVVEEAAESNFKGETGEVGLYLAMARHARAIEGLLNRYFK